jgi:biopolymer transport protein ExbB
MKGTVPMIGRLKDLVVQAGASWVIWLLAGLSVVSIGVMLDRARVFWRQRGDFGALFRDFHAVLGKGDLPAARARLEKSPSVEAAVVAAGLAQWKEGASAAEEAMAAAQGLQRARMQRRLLFLGTVGNNAPFVGLLGTVIGVLGAFDELGRSNAAAGAQLAPERVMGTIAEALVATAIGLLVAIPAVAVFNFFQGLMTSALENAETLGHVLLTHMVALGRVGRFADERDRSGRVDGTGAERAGAHLGREGT